MNPPSVVHSTFVIERHYRASPTGTFAAWSDPELKTRWFAGPDDWEPVAHELDFRIGGRERTGGRQPGGTLHLYEAVYRDIVDDQRIVSTYEMYEDGARTSVSLATVEFAPRDGGTLLTYTEQGAFLDGRDTPAIREAGTRNLLDALAAVLGAAT